MKGLYSGRQIKDLAAKKLKITRSQTAAQAVKAITTKYGSVADNGKYFHTGKGIWVKYSLANDSKRTGKLAGSKTQWRVQPHKLDYPGIDTKKGVEKKEVKAVKRKFSLSSIKPPAKLSSRTKKTPAKMVHKAAVKSVSKPKTLKELNIRIDELRKALAPAFRANRKLTAYEEKLNKEANALIRKRDGIRDRQDTRTKNKEKKIRDAWLYSASEAGIKERVDKANAEREAKKAAVKSMPKKASPSARRRYASFSRPLGSWFNPGVPFKYEDTRASDKDFRYNRMPHTVISTETKISPEKIKSYELVDLAEGRKMQALIKYSNAVKYFTAGMKDQVERQILKGAIATRKDLEPYVAKAKKIMEKKVGL